MYYNDDKELGMFDEFSDHSEQADQQRQFVFCMMMDQIVRLSGK